MPGNQPPTLIFALVVYATIRTGGQAKQDTGIA
jgi:hypothetical protein